MYDYKAFSSLRDKFKYLSEKCFRVYARNVDNSLKNNSCNFWKFIKNNRYNNNILRVVTFNENFTTCKRGSA